MVSMTVKHKGLAKSDKGLREPAAHRWTRGSKSPRFQIAGKAISHKRAVDSRMAAATTKYKTVRTYGQSLKDLP